MLPAWPFWVHAFGDDHKSMFSSSGVSFWSAPRLDRFAALFVISEHFSFEVLLRLIVFVSEGAFVHLDLLTRGCGTPSLGTGVSTGGRAHSRPAPWFLLSAVLSLVPPYVFWPLLPSTVSRLSCALVTRLSRESCASLNFSFLLSSWSQVSSQFGSWLPSRGLFVARLIAHWPV